MKKALTFIILLVPSLIFCQSKVQFDSFDGWKKNSFTGKMEFVQTFKEKGYLEIDNKKAQVILFNERLNQKELFKFTPFQNPTEDHIIAFGLEDTELMFSFIPQDKIILIKVNDSVIFQFDLTLSDILTLKKEFK